MHHLYYDIHSNSFLILCINWGMLAIAWIMNGHSTETIYIPELGGGEDLACGKHSVSLHYSAPIAAIELSLLQILNRLFWKGFIWVFVCEVISARIFYFHDILESQICIAVYFFGLCYIVPSLSIISGSFGRVYKGRLQRSYPCSNV